MFKPLLSITSLLMSLLLAASSCAASQWFSLKKPEKVVHKPNYISLTRNIAGYTGVNIEGVIDVSIHTGYSKHPDITLKGDSLDLQQVKTYVTNGQLHVVLGKGYPNHGRVTAIIHANQLYSFHYTGSGIVKGLKLYSPHLDLCIDNEKLTELGGSLYLTRFCVKGMGTTRISGIRGKEVKLNMEGTPTVYLTGQANLTDINAGGNGRLSLYWVESPLLKICGHGGAEIRLAGIADELHVELWGHSKFDGQYLRARRTFVKTFDDSEAKIFTLKKQHSLASGKSNIYYYNIAEMQTNFMAYDGSVLDMRKKRVHDLEEYIFYNKHNP